MTGSVDHRLESTIRAVSPDGAAVRQRHPDAALGVDREAVGTELASFDEPARRGQARLAVVVEHIRAEGVRVVVVRAEPSGLQASPLETVKPVNTTCADPSRSRRWSAACSRTFVVGHRAAGEAAVRVASALVHPQVLVGPGSAGAVRGPVHVLACEASLDPDDRSAPASGANCCDDAGDVVGARRAVGGMRGCRRRACRASAGHPSVPTRPGPRRGRRPHRSLARPSWRAHHAALHAVDRRRRAAARQSPWPRPVQRRRASPGGQPTRRRWCGTPARSTGR